ncbi:MAG: LLM class flavin-dependent oxidoreductase [Actinomycetota bacterium]
MRFGLALPHYGFSAPEGAEPRGGPKGAEAFDLVRTSALRAEVLGFDSVWVSDHLFYSFARYGADPAPIASLEAMTLLSAVAALTQHVRVGTLVLCAPFRSPGMLAKMASTVDIISGGRLDLGVGAGWSQEEFDAFGFAFGSVGDRFGALEETLRVLQAFGEVEGPVTFDGPSVHLRDAPMVPPAIQQPIPVFVGGKGGPRLLRLAATYAAGWNVVWRVAPGDYAGKVADVRAACERADRDPSTFRLSIGLYGVTGTDEGAAREAFERGRAAFPGGAMDTETWETWRADTLSGSPEQIIERVRAFEVLGVQEIVLSPWVLPFAAVEPEQVELFAERVIAPLRAGAA